MRSSLRPAATLLILVLLAPACSGATDPVAAAEEIDAGAVCQVTDTGGIDDRSFNASVYRGIERAEREFGVVGRVLESDSSSDFTPNVKAFVEQGCDLIVTTGFLLGDVTYETAQAEPEQRLAIVDYAYDDELANLRTLTFATDEAAFLAGYLAAATTDTGTVGTFGGMNIPPVTIFMEGFAVGVEHYNDIHGEDVRLLGWDLVAQDGLFTGDFENQDNGRRTAESLIQNGADIILPVAGPVGLGAVAAARAAQNDVRLIWVDTDGCESAPEHCDVFLTSVVKHLDVAVFDTVQEVIDGTFAGGSYVGTLANGGVGLAPFHNFETVIEPATLEELEELAGRIIDGSLSVARPAA